MPVDMAALPPLQSRRHIGAAVEYITDAADRHGVENRVDRLGIVVAALMQALDAHTFAWRLMSSRHRVFLCSGVDACGRSGLMKRATSRRERQSTFGEAA